jgi:thioredoxin 1
VNLIEVNESNFESEVLQSSVPVVVDFFSERCGPCRMIKPVMSSLAEELGSQAKIVMVDVAANSKLVNDYNINAIPTVLVIRGGKEVHRMVGLGALSKLREAIQP